MRGRIIKALALLGCAAVVAAGCGNGGDDDDKGSGGGKTPSQARELFKDNCGACHTLADAKTSGVVGPDLDELGSTLDEERVREQIKTGGGAMGPEILKGDDADTVAAYVADAVEK